MVWLGLIIGLVIGVSIGAAVMALCCVAGRAERQMEQLQDEYGWTE